MRNIKFTWFEVVVLFMAGLFNFYIAAHVIAAQ